MNPKFSIIIPVYNVASYLHECLDSVLAQTYTSWEAICVDDGSTDGSGAILDEYAARDSRLRVIHKENGGVASARNLGIDKSTGEWLWFVDADDAIHPKALELIDKVEADNRDISQIAIHDVTSTKSNLEDFLRSSLTESYYVCNKDCIDDATYTRVRRAGWGILHKREAVGETRFGSYKIGEDILFNFSIFWKTRKAIVINAALYYYRHRENSAVNRAPKFQEADDLNVTEVLCAKMLLANRQYWTNDSIRGFINWTVNFGWYSFNGMMWRISQRDRTKALPNWIELQFLNDELKPLSFKRRIQLAIIRAIPFGYFAFWVVYPRTALKLLLRIPLYPLVVLTRPLRYRAKK